MAMFVELTRRTGERVMVNLDAVSMVEDTAAGGPRPGETRVYFADTHTHSRDLVTVKETRAEIFALYRMEEAKRIAKGL